MRVIRYTTPGSNGTAVGVVDSDDSVAARFDGVGVGTDRVGLARSAGTDESDQPAVEVGKVADRLHLAVDQLSVVDGVLECLSVDRDR